MDYPRSLVEAILTYHEEIESLKTKVTGTLFPNYYHVMTVSEGRAYTEKNDIPSKTTRIPYNSNRLVEKLCDMTADVQRARKAILTTAEDVTLMIAFTFPELCPKDSKREASEYVDRLVDYLNHQEHPNDPRQSS